jgi:hypothetical protein
MSNDREEDSFFDKNFDYGGYTRYGNEDAVFALEREGWDVFKIRSFDEAVDKMNTLPFIPYLRYSNPHIIETSNNFWLVYINKRRLRGYDFN